jgi:hypothetical protein
VSFFAQWLGGEWLLTDSARLEHGTSIMKGGHNYYSRLKWTFLDPFLETVMSSKIHLPPTTRRWLGDSPLTPYVKGYFDHLIQCRYTAETTENYMAVSA